VSAHGDGRSGSCAVGYDIGFRLAGSIYELIGRAPLNVANGERELASRMTSDWRMPLPRPRDIAASKLDPAFHELHHDIWQVLKSEVLKGYAESRGG
jgi:hypothetical protein